MDPRLRRFIARWTCWVLALAIVIVDAVFMGLDWGGKLEVAPGAHGYMLLFAILLNQAGWEAGRNDTSSGVRYVLGEAGERLAAIEVDVAGLRAWPHLTKERMTEILRAELEPLRRQVADLEQEVAENRILMREIQGATEGKTNGVVRALPRSHQAGEN